MLKQQLSNWIIDHKLGVIEETSGIYRIDGAGSFVLIEPKEISDDEGNVELKIFDDSFSFILSEQEQVLLEECDNLLFSFGGKFYYCPKQSINKPELNLFLYLGKSNIELDCEFSYLGVHGYYELLNGSKDYSEWCRKAKFLGIKTLGICEKNTLAGTLPFQLACKKKEIRSIIGETVSFRLGSEVKVDVKLYCIDEIGWTNLLLVNKELNILNNKEIALNRLLELSEGLVCVIDPKSFVYDEKLIKTFKKAFKYIYYQLDLVEYSNDDRDEEYLLNLKKFVNSDILSSVLINDSYYLEKEDSHIKVILNNISSIREYGSNDQYFKSLDDNFETFQVLFKDEDRLFAFFEESVEGANAIAELCKFQIETGKKHMPEFILTKEQIELYCDKEGLFWSLVEKGVKERISERYDQDLIFNRIQEEYEIIEEGKFLDYFLILWDIIEFCKKNDILVGIGRGSSGGSLLAYLLYITNINPLDYNLLFSRFLNRGRINSGFPDIDTDVMGDRKDEVKRYMEEKYGINQVCSVGTYTTLQPKAAIKDLGRQENLDLGTLNYVTAALEAEETQIEWQELFTNACQKSVVKKFIKDNPNLINDIQLCIGQPKSASIHACAMLILPKEKDVYNWIPVRLGEKDGQKMIVTEWEGEDLADAGFLKEDILGIRQLDKFAFILKLIKETTGESIDIYKIPLNVSGVYELFRNGYNGDVFHFGSKGLTEYSKELQPENIEDLIAMIALYRPGAMESNAHNEYVLLKKGEREPQYDYMLKSITKSTYGLYITQEQIMQAVQVLGGFDLDEADDVRRAMGKKKRDLLDSYKQKFIEGAIKNKCPKDEAEKIWEKLEKFAGYGFNKCISGNERFYQIGHNKKSSSTYHATIGEMYKIRNDYSYAKAIGKTSLYTKYRRGYGCCFSLNENNVLVKRKIKDIRFEGVKPIYRVTLENNAHIDVTLNHKFPTSNGEKRLEDIDIDNDLLYVNAGYLQEDTSYRWGTENVTPSCIGFLSQDTPYTRFLVLEKQLKEEYKDCQICKKPLKRAEIHHKDNDHGNSERENLLVTCPSCHKKEHYKLGRTKVGEKGLSTKLCKITDISFLCNDEVYDVEIIDPYHNFLTNNGIVTSNSHAAAYAITGYISQYLKYKYPIQFWTAAFEFENDNDQISRYISEINQTDDFVKIMPPDINKSDVKFTSDFKTGQIYWSLGHISQCGETTINTLIKERRENGPFFSFDEFFNRVDKSKINKRVVENLILSGSFDELESIREVIDRYKLIQKYRKLNGKTKIDKEKDLFLSNTPKLKEEYWWTLQQKNVCGLGFFNFKKLIANQSDFPKNKFIEFETFIQEGSATNRLQGVVGGVIIEVIEKSSKKGKFAQIRLDCNHNYIWVVLWSEIWPKFKDQILNKEGNILLISGRVSYDSYKKQNILQTEEDTKIQILD